ncbi:MAG: ABC-F type ribosomal protection protein [Defluviitaleaceae bacterium]|nr:ABC-F type ribosomal protection protein [Defluviitaleaceae bacterium]
MSLINIQDLTFAYDGSYDNIFENVSFQLDTAWKLGFTGRNGRGKTTFLNLLLGKYEYSGKISASVDFRYFPHNVADRGVDTISVIEQVCPLYQEWALLRELSILGVQESVLNRPFGTLSNGEQTKVLLAALFLNDNNFLLIDEPTNHLDLGGREIVSRYLNGKAGFILVSHDRAFLDGCVSHILSINRSNIEVQRGNFSSWLANKERQDSFELAENEKLKKDIKRLKQAAKQSEAWSNRAEAAKMGKGAAKLRKRGHEDVDTRAYYGEKSRRMQQRRKNLERRQQSAIDDKGKLLKNLEHAAPLKISLLPYHKERYISLSDVSISYGEKPVCEGVSFTLGRGERIALQGKNGSGKSSILRLICGEGLAFSGKLEVGSGLKISYVSQDTSSLCGNLTDYALHAGIDESLFKAILRKLDFSRVQFEKDMRDFSGGQKKKVLIAKSLCEQAHLLVWDEPLNFIDVLSRIQIEELLLEHKPTILFVEHDSVFVGRVGTGKILLSHL